MIPRLLQRLGLYAAVFFTIMAAIPDNHAIVAGALTWLAADGVRTILRKMRIDL